MSSSTGKGVGDAMIAPIVKFPIAGATWYQGCSNEGEPYEYGELQKLLVTSWRKFFKCDMPYYYVELAARHREATQG